MNAQTGKDLNDEFYLRNFQNGNDKYLADFHERIVLHAYKSNLKRRENYGLLTTKITLKQR